MLPGTHTMSGLPVKGRLFECVCNRVFVIALRDQNDIRDWLDFEKHVPIMRCPFCGHAMPEDLGTFIAHGGNIARIIDSDEEWRKRLDKEAEAYL